MSKISWIGVDWGTTNLRAYAMTDQDDIIAQNESAAGMGTLAPDEFEAALISLIHPWLSDDKTMPVYACGMVGAKQGWIEAPYRKTPCAPVCCNVLTRVPTQDPRIAVSILPGISQASPPNVMRGEETQIAGFLADNPDFEGVICLPGTHCKWVKISRGQIMEFVSFMTGELFALLSQTSVLRFGLTGTDFDETVCINTAITHAENPNITMSSLFTTRAASLLQNTTSGALRGQLSGMLIGQEIAEVSTLRKGQEVALIGSAATVTLYHDILRKLGVNVRIYSGDGAVLSGLTQARQQTETVV